MNDIVQIQNLSIGYIDCSIVNNINANINSSELICIIGRNGEGKSTFIKTLCNLIPSISGKILINTKNIKNLNDKEFSCLISVVLTTKISIPNITVKEFVAFGRYPYTNWIGNLNSKDKLYVNSAIEYCGIKKIENREFSSLSDGEKQKVNIARAIAQNTPIIILDEPTAHLDLVNNIEIFKLLKLLTQEQNKTIIFSTHYIELALQLADKVCVINKGNFNHDLPTNIINNNIINEIFDDNVIKYHTENKRFEFNL